MSPSEPPDDEARTHAPAWSPETETREDVKALLLRRSALAPSEALLFRKVYPEMYDTYLDTLLCVVRCRGARGAVEIELAHDALATFWDETVAGGSPRASTRSSSRSRAARRRTTCAARAATRRPRPCQPRARRPPAASRSPSARCF